MGMGGWRHAPSVFAREWPCIYCLGGCVCPTVGKIASTGIRSLDRPARSESLYWLDHPGSWVKVLDFSMNFFQLKNLQDLKLFSNAVHRCSKFFYCYLECFNFLDVQSLLIKVYRCKVNFTTDVTLHRPGSISLVPRRTFTTSIKFCRADGRVEFIRVLTSEPWWWRWS